MADTILKNFGLLDVEKGKLLSGYQVLIQGKEIARVEKGQIRASGAKTIDLGGRTLMPGLIDCHVHILFVANHAGMTSVQTGIIVPPSMLPSLTTAYVAELLRGLIRRGFTTVRDTGGADLGHKMAVERGLFEGPRLFVSGRAVSQTGGHGDGRNRAELQEPCECWRLDGNIARLADGVPEVRKAVRDEIRLGADQIKMMAGGGVGSAADPIDQLQYSMEEMKAIVDEASRSHTYVLAHAYTADAIRRCVTAGVRTIEHGNLIDDDAARKMGKAGMFLVPTLVTYHVMRREGKKLGLAPEMMAKNAYVIDGGARSLELAKRYGVKTAFGSDLFHSPDVHQSEEFAIRAEVLTNAEVIRSATSIGAEVVRMNGKLGVIKRGAFADLLAVDGDPLRDIRLLTGQGERLAMIMKEGRIVKNALGR
ncbi:MAG: amidohydrolase family protein [Rhodospirillales bacterium]|nr:amidohydrolase family protein [Rhodospirillales bacterium]